MADLQNINDIIKNNKFVVISSGDERTDKGYPIRIFNFKDNSSKNEYVFKIISNTSNGTIKLDFELNSLNKIRGIPTSTNSPIKNIEVNNIKKLIKSKDGAIEAGIDDYVFEDKIDYITAQREKLEIRLLKLKKIKYRLDVAMKMLQEV